jgi:hypothetical protein
MEERRQLRQLRNKETAEVTMTSDETNAEKMKDQLSTEERHVTIRDDLWLALLKIAGQQIDPNNTAEVDWIYGLTLDPYGVYPDLPEEYQQVGREYFARAPGTKVWVSFHDLPQGTRDRLWARHSRKLAFPAGLEGLAEPDKETDDPGVPF